MNPADLQKENIAVMIDGRACELNEMPEVIAREPNGAGIGRDKVLEVALKSIESRLSELRHDDEAKLWLMLNDPHLSYAEGATKLRQVVDEYNRCAQESISADSVFGDALGLIEAQNRLCRFSGSTGAPSVRG